MSAVYLFKLEHLIGNRVIGSLRTQSADKRFLNEKYLAVQILRDAIVSLHGEEAYPRETLYTNKSATAHLAQQYIGYFKLMDYAYPDCRIEFDLLSGDLLHSLQVGSIWDCEVIYFDSDRFYQGTKERWDENTLRIGFPYFVDPTYYPDLSVDLVLHEKPSEPLMASFNDLFQSLAQIHRIYASPPFLTDEGLGLLLDFQSTHFESKLLEEMLLALDRWRFASSIQSVRIR